MVLQKFINSKCLPTTFSIQTEHDRRGRVRTDESTRRDGRTVRRLAENQEDPPIIRRHEHRCEERVTHMRGFFPDEA